MTEDLLEQLPDGELPGGMAYAPSLRKIKDDPMLWQQLQVLRQISERLHDGEGYYHHGLLREHLVTKGKTAETFLFRHVVGNGAKLSDGRVWCRDAVPHRIKGKKYEIYIAAGGKGERVCACRICTSDPTM
jgi:hypothetical protein